MTRPQRHRLGVGVAAALVLLAAQNATAQRSSKEVCATAFDQAQDLRDEGKLLEARAQLRVCERTCPATLTPDCALWRREVEALLATVILSVKDGAGKDVTDVRVVIDGSLASRGLDPALIELDPGRHTFHFERSDGSRVDEVVALQPGEKGRRVIATFPAAAAPAAKRSSRPPPTATYVIGGLGLAMLAASAVLTIKGHVDRQALFRCEPNCSLDDADAIRTTWNIAGGLAAAGAVGLGVAAVIWATAPSAGASSTTGGGFAFRGRF